MLLVVTTRLPAQAPGGAPDPRASFFVSSVGNGAAGGNYGGLTGADQRCQDLAAAANLPGDSWAAYLSTSTVNARDRIGVGPWYNRAGTLIAADVNALHSNGIAASAALDELGNAVPANRHDILTGASQNGGLHPTVANCGGFQTNSASYYVVVGHADGGGVGETQNGGTIAISWNSAHLTDCSQTGMLGAGGDGRLYCFLTEPPPTVTPTLTPTPTPTPSLSATPSRTATITATATSSPTPTVTATPGTTVTDDIDGDGETGPLTDGLLKLRFMFGFSGSALIAGTVDTQNCTRCTAEAIGTYLESIEAELDIDGDGQTVALFDGLLNLRWLFGFRGATLIDGAYDTENCTRCTAEKIDEYIDGLN